MSPSWRRVIPEGIIRPFADFMSGHVSVADRTEKARGIEIDRRVGLYRGIGGAVIAKHATSPQVSSGITENHVVHKEYREVRGVYSLGSQPRQNFVRKLAVQEVAVHNPQRSAREEIGLRKGGAAIVRNVNPDRIKSSDIAQEQMIMASILDVPKVCALDGVNVLRVADARASKIEGSGIKDGRLLEH